MSIAEASFSAPSPLSRSGVWPWITAAVTLGSLAAIAFLLLSDEALPYTARCVVFLAGFGCEALLYRAAARRADISRRLSLALRLLLTTAAIGFVIELYAIGMYLELFPSLPAGVWDSSTLLSYLSSLAAVCCMPMAPLTRQQWNQLILDVVMSVAGITLVFWVLFAPPSGVGSPVTSGLELVLVVVALCLLMIRGRAEPSRLAFWLFVGAELFTCWVVVLNQMLQRLPDLAQLGDACFVLAQMLFICTGVTFWRDPVRTPIEAPTPSWMLSFNPLPVLLIAVIAGFTGSGVVGLAGNRQTLLALGLVALVLLLMVRIVMTARENVRLTRAEVSAAQRFHVEKMNGVGRLAGGIAHEFNNLMTTVIGDAELGMASAGRSEDVRRNLTRILAAADRASSLTQQLLSFSGKQFMNVERLELSDFLRELEPKLQERLPAGVSLQMPLPQTVGTVAIDRAQIHHALTQLTSNAVDAMPSGGSISVSAWTERLAAELPTRFLSVPAGHYAVVEVTDSGSGIPPSQLPQIFDPFFSTKPIHPAAGLGLASVYGAIAAHHGGIVVDSRVGRGTRLKLYFPLIES